MPAKSFLLMKGKTAIRLANQPAALMQGAEIFDRFKTINCVLKALAAAR